MKKIPASLSTSIADSSLDSGVCPSPDNSDADSFQNYDEAFPPLLDLMETGEMMGPVGQVSTRMYWLRLNTYNPSPMWIPTVLVFGEVPMEAI